MTKSEFIMKLRAALENDMEGSGVDEQIDYYSSYISEEVAKGRREEDVLTELGDPWVIARSIIGMEEVRSESSSNHKKSSKQKEYTETSAEGGGVYTSFKEIPKWKIILVLLGIIGVVLIVITVIGGIVTFLAPILIPVILILWAYNRFQRRR